VPSHRQSVLGTLAASLLIAVCALPAASGAAVPAWTTYDHDGARSGVDPDSTSPLTPQLAWQSTTLDGSVYGQPLVYGSRVYVATENDTVYALDAATGAVIWHQNVGTPVSTDDPDQRARSDARKRSALNCCINSCGAECCRMADDQPIFGCIFTITTLSSKRGCTSLNA